MANDRRLPIKVVFSKKEDFVPPQAGGGGAKIFGDVTPELREQLVRQLDDVVRCFATSFEASMTPAVAKVILKTEAIAKCHRPVQLFSKETCPIIGGGDQGEVYVSVVPDGVQRLKHRIRSAATGNLTANISTLTSIEPYKAVIEVREVPPFSPMRLRLFRHGTSHADQQVEEAFHNLAEKFHIRTERVPYSSASSVYAVSLLTAESFNAVREFVGTQSFGPFPEYRLVRTASLPVVVLDQNRLPPPLPGVDYGIVGVVDTGTDPKNDILQPWVMLRHDLVPPKLQCNDHGSFVAGLVAGSRALNGGNDCFPSSQCQIVDFVAIPGTGLIEEKELVHAIDIALETYKFVRVWNISLGQTTPCNDNSFSLLAEALDERAIKHNVLFVVAAGNTEKGHLRPWPPPVPPVSERDRICPPADSVLALTVGSLAHLASKTSCVPVDQPSPFSRRGPAPAYITKPELTHYGGNCHHDGSCRQTGVLSVNDKMQLAEDAGTSFACPIVASMAGELFRELYLGDEAPDATLVKGLLIHSALIRNAPHKWINYRGVGVPADVDEIISCKKSSATVIIQVDVDPKSDFGKRPFPMPKCLTREGNFEADLYITLLYTPPVDRKFGFEYCRTNIKVSFGTEEFDFKKGKAVYDRRVSPLGSKKHGLIEKDLIAHGHKWCPMKLYYSRVKRPSNAEWRLTLDVTNRADFDGGPVKAILILTIADPIRKADVYRDLVEDMNKANWEASDLHVRSRARLLYEG